MIISTNIVHAKYDMFTVFHDFFLIGRALFFGAVEHRCLDGGFILK